MPKPQLLKSEIFVGLNTVKAPDDLNPAESPDCRDDDISEPGTLKTRPGLVRQNSSAMAGGRVFQGCMSETEAETKYEFICHSTEIVTV